LEPDTAQVVDNLIAGARYVARRGSRFALRKIWSAVRLLCSLRAHAEVLEVLAHPEFRDLLRVNPRIPFKYFGPYIAVGLPVRTRRAILVSHYQFLQRRFVRNFVDSVIEQSLILWRQDIGGRVCEITLNLPSLHIEGELCLLLEMEGSEVYRLVFSFGPGAPFGAEDDFVLAVTNIQGAQDFDRVKTATKVCHDVQPSHLLMAALSGVAEATGISRLVGFHETRQLSRGRELYFSYEKFFLGYGGVARTHGSYHVPLPFLEKPVAEIKSNHRPRTLRKRQFKSAIQSAVCASFRHYLK